MASHRYINLADLFDLSGSERDIVLCLARNGPSTLSVLAHSTGLQSSAIRQKLTLLEEKGYIQALPEGKYEAVLGRVGSRTELPLHLWRALCASGRLYSERDIITLRVAIPILQFARSRLVEYADHGPNHPLRVKSFASQLAQVMALTELEQEILRAACLFHDVGNAVDRQQHNLISQQTIEKLAQAGELPFDRQEAEVIGLLCRWHRDEYNPNRCSELNGESVRVGLLASILRVADAMDIDHRRSDYTQRFARVLRMFYPDHLPYWTSLEEILGVRIHCSPALRLQVFTRGQIRNNIQIAMLHGDLASTPLDWRIQEIASPEQPSGSSGQPPLTNTASKHPVLLAFAFEPHSLIMAALSCAHLNLAGYAVELLCFPDVSGYAKRLWQSIIPGLSPREYCRLIVVGDRPEPMVGPQVLKTLGSWRSAGTAVTLLNRHEAYWTRFPALLKHGVEVILGGDWAYFWGKRVSQRELWWALIAALCTRDPTKSILGVGEEETEVSHGLIKLVDGSWLLGGIVQAAGNVVKWFADNFLTEVGSETRALEKLSHFAEAIPPGSEGLLCLPLLAGERSPQYRPEARGLVYGLTFSHTKPHLIRAMLEGIAYRLYSVYELLAAGENPEVVVTGGILNSPVWLQITADFFGKKFRVPNILETSAWGGVLLGLRSLGILSEPEQIDGMIELSRDIIPDAEAHRRYVDVYKAQQELYRRMFEIPGQEMPLPG